jgi:hypothetical protein
MISRKIEIRSWEMPFAKLPVDIARLLTDAEGEAYRKGAAYFKGAARLLGEPGLCGVLDRLADDHPTRVYLDQEDDLPWFAWFGFTFVVERRHVCFRPAQPSIALPDSIPVRLRRFYSHFGGLNDDRSGDFGIIPPERISRVSDADFYFIDDRDDIASHCWMFHSFGNGDYTCWHEDGRGFLLNHEEESLDELPLNEFLDDYFQFGVLGHEKSE